MLLPVPELLEAYLVAYPRAADRRARRGAQLHEPQLAALTWLARLVAADPHPEDPLEAWFDAPCPAAWPRLASGRCARSSRS